MKKKLTSFALIAAMLVMLLPSGLMGTTAYAANSYVVRGVTVPLTDAGDNYKLGGNYWNCWEFAQTVYKRIWGTGFTSYRGTNDDMLRNVPAGDSRLLTAENVKKYISFAEVGAVIRIADYIDGDDGYNGGKATKIHSQILVYKDANGFATYENRANSVGGTSMDYLTWAEYARRWGGAWGNYKYFKYIKWPGAPSFSSDEPTSKPTPRYSPDTSNYKVSYSRALYVRDGWAVNDRMHGDDVKYMQACLYYLGYNIEIDGWYGPGTASVVKQFQVHYGLTADGDCGPATWPAIEKAVADNPKPSAPTNVKININATSFTVGDTVKFSFSADNNPKGYTIGIDKDGTRIITKDVNNPFSISTLEAGSYSAYVTSWNDYGGNDSNRVYFTVNPKPATVTSISFKSLPSKTSYYVGQKLNYSGLVVVAKYSDGSSKELTSGYTCTPAEGTTLTTQGSQLVQVKYENVLSSFYVNVNEVKLSSISIKSKPIKLTYTVGETLITSGLKLTATYNDGSTKEVTSGFTFTPSALNTVGTQKITVTYDGKTTSFDVTVNPKVVDNNALKINVSSANAKPGDEVSVIISLADNPGFNYMKLKVKYDKNAMSLSSTESLNLLDGFSYIPGSNTASNPYVLSWGAAGDSKKNGNLVKLTFKISANTGEGEYPITLTCEDCSNQNDQDVKYQITSGKVSINNKMIGDVNGDGKINGKDATLLMKYLAEWDVTIDKSTSDVNKDGKINGKDATLLMKYLAEWDVTLG